MPTLQEGGWFGKYGTFGIFDSCVVVNRYLYGEFSVLSVFIITCAQFGRKVLPEGLIVKCVSSLLEG